MPAKQQKAKDTLNFYENEYRPRREAFDTRLPPGYNRFVKPKDTTAEKDVLITSGSMGRVNTYLIIKPLKKCVKYIRQ